MPNDGDMRERHGRVLAELAEAGMAMVRRLSDAMQRTDDVQTQAQLGLAFHRVSRAVRQTMALEFRLAQDARREDRGDAAAAKPRPPAETAPPRPPVERTGWNEYESDDSDEALDELDALLEAENVDLGAVHEAVETCIARIRQDLDADPALAEAGPIDTRPGGRLSSPVGGGGPTEGRWRGNAAAVASPASPLHHAAHGPPPPTGEEGRGFNAAFECRLAQDSGGRRSALMGATALPRPLMATPLPAALAWRSSA